MCGETGPPSINRCLFLLTVFVCVASFCIGPVGTIFREKTAKLWGLFRLAPFVTSISPVLEKSTELQYIFSSHYLIIYPSHSFSCWSFKSHPLSFLTYCSVNKLSIQISFCMNFYNTYIVQTLFFCCFLVV